VIIQLDGATLMRACFEPMDDEASGIIVTEINYHSADDFDPGDWIELHSLGGDHDLTGWRISDDQDTHIYEFPSGFSIDQGSFAIIAADIDAFRNCFPAVEPVLGDLGFNLSNGGDQIRLFDQTGLLVDIVEYDDRPPWPVEPDGNGPTLRLIDPALDNALCHNWSASLIDHGDPGVGYTDFLPLTLLPAGGLLTLSWPSWPLAHEYWIYGAMDEPFFDPILHFPFHYRLTVLSGLNTRWTIAEGLDELDLHATYQVVVVDEQASEMIRSQRMGAWNTFMDHPRDFLPPHR